ncbi:hypothetical protein [Streptomyces niveus]|uniref:hypothetical protein n=1 Tax=Streptomyces niveus TaxID=193462 RepID=UPI00341D35BF
MSAFRLDEREKTRAFGAYLAALEQRLAALERSNPLTHAALDGGAIEVFDDEGSLQVVIGDQADGTSGVVQVNGPPPPTPTAPALMSVLGGVGATWPGTYSDADAPPLDFSRVEIHASPLPGFTPDRDTQVGTIESPRGGTFIVAADTAVYVRLVARTVSGTAGEPSGAAGPLGPAAVVAQDVLDGIVTETKLAAEAVSRAKIRLGAIGADQLALGIGNLVPDPSFEGPGTVRLLADLPAAERADWTLVPGGRDSVTALTVDCTSPVLTWKNIELARFPVLPGERHFLALDYRVSPDFNGTGAKAFLRYEDAAGAVLGYGVAEKAAVPGGDWDRATAQILAPPNTAAASLRVEASEVTTGRAWYDNLELRTVIAGGMVVAESISAAELAANSVIAEKIAALAISAEKIAALAVTTDKLQALAVTADKLAVNSVTASKILAGSIEAAHIKAGSISADRLTIVGGTNLLPDPSFEGPGGAALVAGQTYWSIAPMGNGSAKSVQVNAVNVSPVIRTLTLATFPVLPGQQLRLETDVMPSTDWAGASLRIYVRWSDSAGVVTFGFVTATSPARNVWQRIQGTVTAPAGTISAEVRLATYDSTAGSVLFDNTIVQPVLSRVQIGDGAITAEKISADALTGKTITGGTVTGAVVESGTANNRVVMEQAGSLGQLRFESGDGAQTLAAVMSAGTGSDGPYLGVAGPSKSNLVGFPARLILGSEPGGGSVATRAIISAALVEIGLGRGDITLNGDARVSAAGGLTASNIRFGRVTVTPSAPNTPTPITVTGLGMAGGTPRIVASPATATPGTSVTGVGVTNASTTGMTIWVTRTSTTDTGVDWIAMGTAT